MAESLVALGHPVGLFLPLHGRADTVGGVKQLERELLGHRFPTSLASETDQPAAGEGETALGPDLDRELVGGAAHPPRLDIELGGGVADREDEDLQRLLAGL